MQQRQLRLGDILDDYCPRERRVTNHAIVAMVGADVKQTRCTTCDADHEYKHARVPRQRRKPETPAALYAQVAANGPKRVVHDEPTNGVEHDADQGVEAQALDRDDVQAPVAPEQPAALAASAEQTDAAADVDLDGDESPDDAARESGPVHRPLIRASLPRPEGQQPPARPIPEFTIRQPAGRPGRFRPRNQRGGQQMFHGNRGNGNFAGPPRGMRPGGGGGHPPQGGRRHGPPGRKRSK